MAQRGVDDKIVGIEFAAAVAATAVHRGIGGQRQATDFLSPKSRCGISGFEAVVIVKGIERGEVIHLAITMAPVDVAYGADVQCLAVKTNVATAVQRERVHGVHLALQHTCQHGVVLGMVPVDARFDVPRPIAFLADVMVGAEGGVGVVGTADIHGFEGADARGGVVGQRLCDVAMMVAE